MKIIKIMFLCNDFCDLCDFSINPRTTHNFFKCISTHMRACVLFRWCMCTELSAADKRVYVCMFLSACRALPTCVRIHYTSSTCMICTLLCLFRRVSRRRDVVIAHARRLFNGRVFVRP